MFNYRDKTREQIFYFLTKRMQFSLNSDLYICLCYVVPENSSRQTLIETHTFYRLLEFITNLDANDSNELNFVLCGDLNAHTSDLPDYVAFATFLENLIP